MKTKIIALIFLLSVSSAYSQWTQVTSGTTNSFFSIQFLSSKILVAVGFNGTIAKSTNAGITWSGISGPDSASYFKVFFPNNIRGWIAGLNGIYRTTNGGLNWSNQITGVMFRDLYFQSILTGYAVGEINNVRKTVTGGSSFSTIVFNGVGSRRGVKISNGGSFLYLLANSISNDSSFVFKSTDNGDSWLRRFSVIGHYTGIDFNDSLTGLICGENGQIRRTTNGGLTWGIISVPGVEFTNVKFNSPTVVYACGELGKILKSTNTGVNWITQATTTAHTFAEMDFIPSTDTGIICGTQGIIFKTDNGGIISSITNGNNIPLKYSLSQNYPNPFNPETKIEFDIPKEGFVQLKVYDLLGREVARLVNGNISPGSYSLNFNASELPGGVYFYRITANEFIETKKMILTK